jgi:hypothetical protein
MRPYTWVCILHVKLCVHTVHKAKYINVRQEGARDEWRKLPIDTFHNYKNSDCYEGVKGEGVEFFF